MRRWLVAAGLVSALFALAIPRAAMAEDESSDDVSAVRKPGGLLDANAENRAHMLSFFAMVPWYHGYGFGGGMRYTIPIVPKGFIDVLNDSVEIEFGGDIWTISNWAWYGYGYAFGSSYSATCMAPAFDARWTFHITDRFSAYGKIGSGWIIALYNNNFGVYTNGPYVTAGPGILFRVGDRISLRAEIQNMGLRGGLGISF